MNNDEVIKEIRERHATLVSLIFLLFVLSLAASAYFYSRSQDRLIRIEHRLGISDPGGAQ